MTSYRMRASLLFAAALCATSASSSRGGSAADDRARLVTMVGEEAKASGQSIAVFVTGRGIKAPYGAGSGPAELASRRPFTSDVPIRIASNTKTFVAATVLRLWEDKRIDLEATVGALISPDLDASLKKDGYRTDQITVRQLLSHSAGLYDHGSDSRFVTAILADPRHHWSRAEQIDLMIQYADPQSAPGTRFQYSDDDYLLLGDIIERRTGMPLATAVRQILDFKRLGLRSTWWEAVEVKPATAQAIGEQMLKGTDVRGIDPSMDLYGGGGLVMSMRDLATFTAALFEGRVFKRASTINAMLWQGNHGGSEKYRLGIFVKHVNGQDFYWHSGFWGTLVYYDPRSHVAVAGALLDQAGFKPMRALVEKLIGAGPVATGAGG